MSNLAGLAATYDHPLSGRWARPEGPWGPETLDDLFADDARVAAVAGGLRAAGVGRGSVVAWQLPNGPDPITLFRACWRLGAVAGPVHHLAGPSEVESLLARLNPTVFITPDDPLPHGQSVRAGSATVSPADLAVALATSGSTGPPKLALHAHRALVHKVRVMTQVHRLGLDDCTLMPAPMAHISGLLNGVLMAASGMRVVPVARWDPEEALHLIRRERVTFMIGPPAYFVSLVDAPGFSRSAVGSLRQISCGGAGVTSAFVRATSEALGCRVKRTYGSTEAPTITTSSLDDPPDRAAETDGHPVGHVELRLADGGSTTAPDGPAGLDESTTAAGPVGELLVRGPELFVGYDDPAATEAAFLDGGWFRTGDLATIDADGWLTIVGRLKDVIIRGGENIPTAEVESVLEAHPDVRAAAVVGMPDRRLGERVCAFVVTTGPFDLPTCQQWFADQGVTRFKWPERVERLPELPLLPAGKPDRTALRHLASGGRAQPRY